MGRLGAQEIAGPPAGALSAADADFLAELSATGWFARLASAWPKVSTTLAALRRRLVPLPTLIKGLRRDRGRFKRRPPERKPGRAVAGLRWPAADRRVPRPRYLARLREDAAALGWLVPAARGPIARMRRLALDGRRRGPGLALERAAIAFAQAERDLAGEPANPEAKRLFLDLRHAAERAQPTPTRAGVRRLGLEIGLKELDLKVAEGEAVGPAVAALRAQLRDWVGKARLATDDAAIEAIVAEAAGALQRVDRLVRPAGAFMGPAGARADGLRARIQALQVRLEAAPDAPTRQRLRLRLAWRRHALRHLA